MGPHEAELCLKNKTPVVVKKGDSTLTGAIITGLSGRSSIPRATVRLDTVKWENVLLPHISRMPTKVS